MIQDLPADDWMLRETLRPAIAAMVAHDLAFDALVLPRHLQNLDRFLNRYQDLTVVIDHCAKPEIRNGGFEPWGTLMGVIAKHDNVFCKISGLVTEAKERWTGADVEPYVDHVANIFGPKRVLFGSDWPVLNLASDYAEWNALALSFERKFLTSDAPGTLADNSYRAYPRMAVQK